MNQTSLEAAFKEWWEASYILMNQTSLEAAFKEWWEASYGRPPGTHAVMTHAAFAAHVLELMELMGEASEGNG